MSDKLENFVRNNRDKFDTQTPRPELWDKIQQGVAQSAAAGGSASVASQAAAGVKSALAWKIGAAGVALLAVVATVWVLSSNPSSKNDPSGATGNNSLMTNQAEPDQGAKPFINPPLAKATILYQEFKVDAQKGGELNLENGTQIIFPESAFVHADGSPVVGKVEIRYREFHDAADIILSGIPMTYTKDGKEEIFETAGMMEILGFQKGNPVQIAPGKEVKFAMATYATEDNYNFYFLDQDKRAWTDRGKPKMGKNLQKLTIAVENDSTSVDVPRKPVDPAKINEIGEIGFDVKNTSDFPELRPFRNIRWVAKDPAYLKKNEWILTKVWSDIRIVEAPGDQMAYNMILKNKSGTFTLPALPVLEGDDYEKAMANFREKKGKYDKLLAQRKTEDERIQKQADLQYSFSITGFGIFNCDRFLNNKNAVSVIATFGFNEEKYVNLLTTRVFHVLTDRSVLTLENIGKPQKIAFPTNGNSFFVALLQGGEVAMITSEELMKMNIKDNSRVTIPMHETGQMVQNANDLRELLQI